MKSHEILILRMKFLELIEAVGKLGLDEHRLALPTSVRKPMLSVLTDITLSSD